MKLAAFSAAILLEAAEGITRAGTFLQPAKSLLGKGRSGARGGRHKQEPVEAPEVLFGDTECPCIGFDNIEGVTNVSIEGVQYFYPADLGSRCEDWDNGVHPSCQAGSQADFCTQQWCYVDACNCRLPELPQPSFYAPTALYRGRPLSYSYAACHSEDFGGSTMSEVGEPGCQCIGFDDMPGSFNVTLTGSGSAGASVVRYPAELGGTCNTWDQGVHPECQQGANSPSWCAQRWCYVNPCTCDLAEPPKVGMYLPNATFNGLSLYYSYETCGSEDTFTAEYNLDACVNQMSEDECLEQRAPAGHAKCAWTGTACLGWEIVEHPLCREQVQRLSDTGGFLPDWLTGGASSTQSGAPATGHTHAPLAGLLLAALAAGAA